MSKSKSKSKHPVEAPRGTLYNVPPEELVIIGLDEIDDGSTLNDERLDLPLNEKLVLDIMKYGIRENVVGRKNKATGRVEVVDGRQRTLCAREANRRLAEMGEEASITVPVGLVWGDDELMFELQVALNHRVESTPLMRARTASRYLLRVKDRQKVCSLFGISEATLDGWLSLLQMGPEVHAAVEAKKISAHQALKLAHLTRARQKKAVEQLIALGGNGTRKGEGTDKKRVPSKGALLNIIHQDLENKGVDPAFILGIRFALGLVDVKDVPELAKAVKGAKK